MQKRKVGTKIFLIVLLLILLIPTCCASEEHYFYNSDVFVIGKCRTIYSSDGWTGGFFRGYRQVFGASSNNAEGENVFIFIRTNGSLVFKTQTSYFSFVSRNSTGIFMWNLREIHIGECPWIFITCHSDLIRVELYNKGG
jgi:hypothetical protein